MGAQTVDANAPFATTLREAIEQRGLGLNRIVARLEEAGTPVSAATLSYWQSGRSRPGRRTSLDCLQTLETILELPPGRLTGQLGRPATRGRNQQRPSWAELWDEVPEVVDAYRAMRGATEDHLTRISYHDRLRVGPDRTERSTWTRQVMRCERDGVDRFVVMHGNDDPTCPVSEVRGVSRCRVGRSTSVPGSGIITSELVLPRPLQRGEFIAVEYVCVQSPPYPPADRYERRRRMPNRQYQLEVLFHPDALPVRCESYTDPIDGEPTVEPLPLDPEHGLLLVEIDGRPGVIGARWVWPEDGAGAPE